MVAEREPLEIYAWCLACRDRCLMLDAAQYMQGSRYATERLAHKGVCADCGNEITTIGFGMDESRIPLAPKPVVRELSACPREVEGMVCGGPLKRDKDIIGHLYICLHCGWNGDAPAPKRKPQPIRFVARYTGNAKALRNRIVVVNVRRVKNRLVFAPQCPWCDVPMGVVQLSGRRPNKRQSRYMCDVGHRISIHDEETMVWE